MQHMSALIEAADKAGYTALKEIGNLLVISLISEVYFQVLV